MAPLRTRELLIMEMARAYVGGVSERTLREQVKKGNLRAYRPGGGKFSRLMFAVEDLDDWMDSVEVRPEDA